MKYSIECFLAVIDSFIDYTRQVLDVRLWIQTSNLDD